MISIFKASINKLAYLALISVVTANICLAEDINGTWHFDYGYDMTFSGGSSFTGTGGPANGYTWVISNGVLTGNQISWSEDYNEITYHVDRTGTISGNTITGSWTTSWGQSGNFIANRISGGTSSSSSSSSSSASSGSSDSGQSSSSGISVSNTGKRSTAISLFCNRTGVGLSTASCGVTVGDKGAPPRTTPSGQVSFLATGGFFPANGACNLQQTPYSPGVASCIAEFAVPFGFPIGVKFPIDVTYPGDTTFAGSSTGHTLIQAGCIGDQSNPCSGAVALSFANLPQIIKNAISANFECGPVTKKKSISPRFGNLLQCVAKITGSGDLAHILAQLSQEQLKALGPAISNMDAMKEPLLKILKEVGETPEGELRDVVNDEQKLNNLILEIDKEQNKKSPLIFSRARAKRVVTVEFGTTDISVKNNSIKTVKIRFNKRAAKILKVLKAVGLSELDLKLSIKGKRSSGPKKPFSNNQTVTFGVV